MTNATVRISDLPIAASVSDDDLVPIVQGGTTKRATVGQIQTSVLLDETFLTVANESGPLPASRRMTFSGGLTSVDGGAGSTFTVQTLGLLNSLSSLGTSGIIVNNGGVASSITLVQPVEGITIANANGTAGNPTFALANDLAALEGLGSTGFSSRIAADTWAVRSLVQPAAGITITNNDGVAGNPTFALANDLAALEGLGATGFAVRSAADTWVQRTITAPNPGITITNGDGVAGNPSIVAANDLAAIEALSTTGFPARTGSDTWALRTVTGTANEITATNGDGVAGNPTLSLPAALTFTGKTITGGIYSSPTITSPTFSSPLTVPNGGTGAGTFTANGILLGNGISAFSVTAAMTDGQLLVGQTGAAPLPKTVTGDASVAASGALTLATVNANVGSFGSTTQVATFTVNGKGLITAAANASIAFPVTSVSGTTNQVTVSPTTGATVVSLAGPHNFTTLTSNGVLLGNGTSAISAVAAMTDGQLIVGATGAAPTARSVSGYGSLSSTGVLTVSKVLGTTTNDNAAAGDVGEFVSSSVASGSAVSLTTGTAVNITSISLTAGDWDVDAFTYYNPAATTSVTNDFSSISTTSATQDSTEGRFTLHRYAAFVPAAGFGGSTGRVRLSLNATTTVYLVSQAAFTVSTMSTYGIIRARRVR